MTILNKSVISLIVLLSGCTLGDNLEHRYTKETFVPAHMRNNDVCLSLPIQNNETVVSAITYNVEKPLEQIIFPSDKQPKSGLFCILPTEFKFKTGQEYLTQIEVNIRTNGEDKKSTRKAYVSTFQVVPKGDSFNIIQTAHK
ncbi:putative T6SS immunity periplasmic lipoprotein [Kosakonia sacchari]